MKRAGERAQIHIYANLVQAHITHIRIVRALALTLRENRIFNLIQMQMLVGIYEGFALSLSRALAAVGFLFSFREL